MDYNTELRRWASRLQAYTKQTPGSLGESAAAYIDAVKMLRSTHPFKDEEDELVTIPTEAAAADSAGEYNIVGLEDLSEDAFNDISDRVDEDDPIMFNYDDGMFYRGPEATDGDMCVKVQ